MLHKFQVGQVVTYSGGMFNLAAHASLFSVILQPPSDGDENQYRIRSLDEPFERMARESQLGEN